MEEKAKDLVDSSIMDNCSLDEVLLCIHVALLCVQEKPDDQPLMTSVVFVLENGSTTLPTPNTPTFFVKQNTGMENIRENSINTFTHTEIEGR